MAGTADDDVRRGRAAEAAGRRGDALSAYRRAVAADPRHAEARRRLGRLLHRLGRAEEAAHELEVLVALAPDDAKAHNTLGIALAAAGRRDEARARLERAVALDPDLGPAWHNLGNLLRELRRPAEAIGALDRAAALTPDLAAVHHVRGLVLRALGRAAEAAAALRRAAALAPDRRDIRADLGAVCCDLQRWDEAVAIFDRDVADRPDRAASHYALGVAHMGARRFATAERCFRRATELDPNLPEAWNNLGKTLKDQARLAEAADAFRRCLALAPDKKNAQANLLFCLHYDPSATVDELREAHLTWGRRLARPPRAHGNDRDPDRPLRVGYVSGDLARHPIGWFLRAVFAHHDPARVRVHAYHQRPAAEEDDLTAELRGRAWRWASIAQLDDDALEALIRRDGIDVLIDMSGHTRGNRLAVFARKPAPIQAHWYGYVGTTGLVAIDWWIADRFRCPPGAEGECVERVWRMPESYGCWSPPPEAPDVAAPDGAPFTFGSLNNLPKLNPRVVALWARVLAAVPDARLLLKTKALGEAEVRDRVAGWFADAGVPAERLVMEGFSPPREALATYHRIDVALDAFPFTGGQTTLEALWMGVPVLTLAGDRLASRNSEAILRVLGLDDLVAADPDAFVDRARQLAADATARSTLRRALRPRLAGSIWCDGARFTRQLEDSYRAWWQAWCRGDR